LEQQRDALLAELRGLGNLMRGTIGTVGVKCGRPGCACAQGARHAKIHLSVNLHGRTRSCYLGRAREAVVAPLIAEYERAWRLITDLTAVNSPCSGGRTRGAPARRGGGRDEPGAAAVHGSRRVPDLEG